MRQVRVTGPGRVEVVEAPAPEPGEGRVLLELHSAGICGGDLSLVRGTNAIARYPTVPGHECVARVVVAPGGSGLSEGDHVVVYPTVSCGRCRACAAGRTNQCADIAVMGLSLPDGCFADRFVVDAEQCVPLPEDVGPEHGALIEPVAVGCHVVARGGVRDGDTALVIGSGTIGMSTAMVARAMGVGRILFADLHPSRASVLAELGFHDFTVASGDELVAWTEAQAGRVDLVYDTVAQSATAGVAAEVLAGGGRYIAIGAAKPGHRLELPYERFYARELSMIACRNYSRADFRAAVELIAGGRVDPRPLRTGVYGLADVQEAFTALTERPADHLKILMTRSELVGSSELLAGGPR
ncbi:zinc-dependent alcohol dehydrogenase [Actinomadura sp. HBU206391]|uniref:zinc-dependent alcohol dehydrogenase n=1 Tax=Actinomadura sp. HBU206391 TaxID=2731692 RepID=UPI0016500C2A|nr:alcohol dehydrogenase catalytic domain-containing protein [Actinomadura sp. HBU206391]MBC6456513.1 alcohol dehydrogenase catalytic domain-containing protein [Actinomadura sp. HBU206391]